MFPHRGGDVCLLTFEYAWDSRSSLKTELVVPGHGGSDEKASEHVSPDYRVMRNGREVR